VDVALIRHGESTWNRDGRWQGQADPPLSERGRDQAARAARSLPPADLVVASDLRRAHRTALILVGSGGAVGVEPELRERDAGAFSGLTRAQIHQRCPGLLPDDPIRAADPPPAAGALVAPPGWEPDEALRVRAWRALDRLAARLGAAGGGRAWAVTHSGLIY